MVIEIFAWSNLNKRMFCRTWGSNPWRPHTRQRPIFKLPGPAASWELFPWQFRAPSQIMGLPVWIQLMARFFAKLNGISFHKAIMILPVILIWLKYCWKGNKNHQLAHPSMISRCTTTSWPMWKTYLSHWQISHVKRKPIFRGLWLVTIQTSLFSDRS